MVTDSFLILKVIIVHKEFQMMIIKVYLILWPEMCRNLNPIIPECARGVTIKRCSYVVHSSHTQS